MRRHRTCRELWGLRGCVCMKMETETEGVGQGSVFVLVFFLTLERTGVTLHRDTTQLHLVVVPPIDDSKDGSWASSSIGQG